MEEWKKTPGKHYCKREKYCGRPLDLQKAENNLMSCIPLHTPGLYKSVIRNVREEDQERSN